MRSAPVLLLALSACSFDPPAVTLPVADASIERKDAIAFDADPLRDADLFEDADLDAESVDADTLPADANESDSGEPDIGRPDADVDAGVDPDIPHLGPGDRALGTGAFVLTSRAIDTDDLTIGALPLGVVFEAVAQFPSGPELAVLRVGSLDLPVGNAVRAEGTRPLVILSAGDVIIAGTLDLSAAGATPGAGGFLPSAGSAPGGDGMGAGSYGDSGGGGAGHATQGQSGGSAWADTVAGGGGGALFGMPDIPLLTGGSGGGRGSGGDCSPSPGGAGGGALQIYSAARIQIAASGVINAGGGGGGPGPAPCSNTNAGAGAGGGAGGAIVLMAPMIEHLGRIAANGGGGGGGGSSDIEGDPGDNAHTDASAALGGVATGVYGERGGDSGYGTTIPATGDDAPGTGGSAGNAGGGGGAVGRIYTLSALAFSNQGIVSPPATSALYP